MEAKKITVRSILNDVYEEVNWAIWLKTILANLARGYIINLMA